MKYGITWTDNKQSLFQTGYIYDTVAEARAAGVKVLVLFDAGVVINDKSFDWMPGTDGTETPLFALIETESDTVEVIGRHDGIAHQFYEKHYYRPCENPACVAAETPDYPDPDERIAAYDPKDPQFWTCDLDELNMEDLRGSMVKPGLVGLVDEAQGGIIAYVIRGQEASLLAHLGEEV